MIGPLLLGLAALGLACGWGWVRLARAEEERLVRQMQQELGTARTRRSRLAQVREAYQQTWPGRRVAQLLQAAHLPYPALDASAAVLLGFVGLFYLSRTVLGLNSLNALLTAVISAGAGLRYFLLSRRDWFLKTFNHQLPDAAWILGNAMRAGLSIPQGLALVAAEAPNPARSVFAQIAAKLDLNEPLAEALEEAQGRLQASREFRLLVLTILVQYRSGGNLARALEILSHTLAERKGINEEVQSSTAGARSAATILPFMPIICTVIMNLAIPGFLNSLFTFYGLLLVIPFVILQWLAYVLIRSMADIKV